MNRRTSIKSYPILEDLYEIPILVDWNQDEIERQVSSLVDSIISQLESTSPKYSILKSYSYGRMPVQSGEIKNSISFQFLKNPTKVEYSEPTVLSLSYKNILKIESRVDRGQFNVDIQNDNVNPWLCFPDSANSLKEAQKSKEFGDNIIDLLKNEFRPKFIMWAMKTLKKSWMDSGTIPEEPKEERKTRKKRI